MSSSIRPGTGDYVAVGIDPGRNGAVGWIVQRENGDVLVGGKSADTTEFLTVQEILSEWRPLAVGGLARRMVGVEATSPMVSWSGRACYVLGAATQGAKDAAQGMGFPVVTVDPKKWRGLALAGKRMRAKDPRGRKKEILLLARERWPWIAETLLKTFQHGSGIADALFIARWIFVEQLRLESKTDLPGQTKMWEGA